MGSQWAIEENCTPANAATERCAATTPRPPCALGRNRRQFSKAIGVRLRRNVMRGVGSRHTNGTRKVPQRGNLRVPSVGIEPTLKG